MDESLGSPCGPPPDAWAVPGGAPTQAGAAATLVADSASVDGIHDMGGMEGFGPVVAEAGEPPFHEPWEGRVHGMMLALATKRGISSFRYLIETMGNERYLRTPYYEHWLH